MQQEVLELEGRFFRRKKKYRIIDTYKLLYAIMGNCMSDVKGGKQAIGGGPQTVGGGGDGSAAASGHNDAVDYFFRAKGEHALFSPIEV